MIVYGDPTLRVRAAHFIHDLRKQGRAALTLDDFRSVLIGLGQLEQAIADDPKECLALTPFCEQATDCVAAGFCAAFLDELDGEIRARANLQRAEALLEKIAKRATGSLELKIPEGFAFYALYPEQYIVSARRWAGGTGGPSRALVIGVRSIGTTLSAVVAETLRTVGWATRRLTVRPAGEPFHRIVQVSAQRIGDADYALVVDEGPGLSGSSMAAVAEALVTNGFPRQRIIFFPGHEHGPSGAVTPNVEKWWRETPQFVTSLEKVRWKRRSLAASLCHAAERLFGHQGIQCADVSAGAWRRFAFDDEAEWPAAYDRFERTKYLLTLADGRRVLWKFAGLLSRRSPARLLPAAEKSRVAVAHPITRVAPLGFFRGFQVTEWHEGRRWKRTDIDSGCLGALARYIHSAAVEPDSSFDHFPAIQRLAAMLCQNVLESLGEAAARNARALADEVMARSHSPRLLYGDGRLAPSEFVCGPDRRLYKTDGEGHDVDHTMVGRQPILWDVAGAIVEWRFGPRHRAGFLSALRDAGVTIDANVLRFYCASYAAFRLGMAAICELTAADPERSRLNRAAEFYRQQLAGFIHSPGRAGTLNPLAA